MKKYSRHMIFLLLPLFAAVISGCVHVSEREVEPVGGKGNNYLSLTVNLSGRGEGSRSYVDDWQPIEVEILIDGARLVLYSNSKVVLAKDFDVTNVSIDDPNAVADNFTGADVAESYGKFDDSSLGEYGFRLNTLNLEDEGVDLTADDFRILMILNPNDNIRNVTAKGKTIADLEAAVDYNEADFIGAGRNRFLMTNSHGLVKANKYLSFRATEEEAGTYPVKIGLYRAVGLVYVTLGSQNPSAQSVKNEGDEGELIKYTQFNYPSMTDPGTTYKANAGAMSGSVRWGLNIVNKKSFWLRKMTYDYYGDMEMPGWTRYYYEYAEDPNFEGFSSLGGGTQQDRIENFVYIQDAASEIAFTPNTEVYIPENTVGPRDQRHFTYYVDAATSVVVKIEMKLYESVDPVVVRANTLLENHFFVIDYYNSEYFENYDEIYKEKNHILGTRNNINDYLSKVYEKMEAGDEMQAFIDDPMDIAQWENYLGFKPVVEHLLSRGWNPAVGNPDWDNIESFEAGDFRFYNNGVMYYTIPVVHFNGSSYYGEFTGYGVVRNNIYEVHIDPSYISNPGSIIPKTDGQLLDGVEIIVSPWKKVQLDFPIGEEYED